MFVTWSGANAYGLSHGDFDLVVPVCPPNALAKALENLIRDFCGRQAMRDDIRILIDALFSYVAYVAA